MVNQSGFTGARDSECQWHQLGYMQICTLPQTYDHTSTQPLSFFTGRMPFLLPNQQCQSTEGSIILAFSLKIHQLSFCCHHYDFQVIEYKSVQHW